MRWDVFAWAALALLLFAAEALAPGAFMLWLGLAAAAVFLGACCWCPASRCWCRRRPLGAGLRVGGRSHPPGSADAGGRATSPLEPAQRGAGRRVLPLSSAIVDGRGRVQIAGCHWRSPGRSCRPAPTCVSSAGDAMTLQVEPA